MASPTNMPRLKEAPKIPSGIRPGNLHAKKSVNFSVKVDKHGNPASVTRTDPRAKDHTSQRAAQIVAMGALQDTVFFPAKNSSGNPVTKTVDVLVELRQHEVKPRIIIS